MEHELLTFVRRLAAFEIASCWKPLTAVLDCEDINFSVRFVILINDAVNSFDDQLAALPQPRILAYDGRTHLRERLQYIYAPHDLKSHSRGQSFDLCEGGRCPDDLRH